MMKINRVAVSVFFIAFAVGLNITGISPVLGIVNEKYQQYGTSVVQLLHTLPYLLLMLGSLLVGWWTAKASKKKIVSLGLLIIGFCGVLPFFSDSFFLLFLSRLLIGFGFGISSPLNAAVITELVEEENRAGYMGLHVVGMGIGTMTGNLFGGMLSGLGYRFFYLVYMTAFISWFAVQFLLPETPAAAARKADGMKLNAVVYGLSAASFAHTLFINAYSTNIGIYLIQNITQDTSMAGIVTAVNAAFALLMGVLFARISGILKIYTVPVSIFAAAAGFGAVLFIPGMAGAYLASACCGISLSCFMAGCSMLISVSVEPEAVTKANGIFSVIGGIGGLIAPVFMGNAASAVFGENTAVNQFAVACMGMSVLGIVMMLAAVRRK